MSKRAGGRARDRVGTLRERSVLQRCRAWRRWSSEALVSYGLLSAADESIRLCEKKSRASHDRNGLRRDDSDEIPSYKLPPAMSYYSGHGGI